MISFNKIIEKLRLTNLQKIFVLVEHTVLGVFSVRANSLLTNFRIMKESNLTIGNKSYKNMPLLFIKNIFLTQVTYILRQQCRNNVNRRQPTCQQSAGTL